jgi:hypothetical protein
MKYMLLIYTPENGGPTPGSPEFDRQRKAWMDVSADMAKSGAMQSGDALESVSTATTVRIRDGEQVVSDGPFAETKEILGGFYVVDVPDIDAAIAWAAKLPNAPYGSVEVRPVMEIPQG